jgi:hypothetical protein
MRAHCSDADHAPLSRVSLERRNKRLQSVASHIHHLQLRKSKRESDVLAGNGNGKGRYGTVRYPTVGYVHSNACCLSFQSSFATSASPDHVDFIFPPRNARPL